MSVAACCDNIQVHSNTKDFSHSKYIGDFHLYENIEGDPVPCNEAAVFISTKGKLYVYRSKDGDWVVGTTVGNNKKGVHMRSQDPDRNDYIHECPCQTKSWQKMDTDSNKWQGDPSIRVLIRQAKVVI
eukprot:TRINITY_DN13275_c0_g1_i1.p1 TRINITY_DN13275_c0_g1~~TRINITY_DN13275_c0_g1_i1.p1  ORF type:complete len:128 (+),score=40.88 TRINITY_DN13275_c0_g1_i1:68-451(+)